MGDFSLKAFREQRGLSQQTLADRLGVAKNYIYLIESGRKPMTSNLRLKLDSLDKQRTNSPAVADGETNSLAGIEARVSDVAARLDRLEKILLDVLARLPPRA